MKRIAVLTNGLWRQRREIGALTGMKPVHWLGLPASGFSAVAGWGHGKTAARARRLAAWSGKPYFAFEDGPLRSVRPGPSQPAMSLVIDRSGIYYDAATHSDLIASMVDRAWLTPALAERARRGSGQLQRLRLSKYNAGPERTLAELGLNPSSTHRVLVLDQVRGDASIRGALADADAFREMLDDARAGHPGAEIVVKRHPDVTSGRRQGYFDDLAAGGGVRIVGDTVNPWSLLAAVDTVFTVSSGLGFEAALAGRTVVTYGSPFYAGWGFTEDRRLKVARPAPASPLELFAAYYLRYAHYLDAYSREEVSFERAADQLAWLRDRFLSEHSRAICHRITRWKRKPVERMLDGPAGPPLHAADAATAVRLAKQKRGRVVAWASRNNAELERECREADIPLVRLEDGFIRSAGLGASFVQPLSLVFDENGIYYDSGRESALERMLQDGDFPPALLERARRLRESLVAAGTTKYNVREESGIRIDSGGRPVILVPGQVEDDASIERGSPHVKHNIDLLKAARARHPEAFVIYKPHPDVESGFRMGRVPRDEAAAFADLTVSRVSILSLIEASDRVETITSLAGFEALLRGKPVTTHGQPFYAGWGLTEDLAPVTRRTRRATLDELVAATLILYPRYVDPASGLACTPELLVERLQAAAKQRLGLRRSLVRGIQISAARALYVGQTLKQMARRNG